MDENQAISSTGIAPLGVAVEVKNVTVTYRSYQERPSSLKEAVVRMVTKGQFRHYQMFNALSDLSLSITRGTVLGIVGSNGSGKSTLLKVIAQVLKPTSGKATVSGRVSSLIELGVGFDPELNAIENIFLNGSLHRKSRAELRERVEPILEFAELKDFATTPIKYYSSGMAARLGFSVAVDINPDILLVDEILGVGDERFQAKCQKVFHQFLNSSKTIVIVSHNIEMLESIADRVALLSRGRLAYLGDPRTATRLYRDRSYQTLLS